MRRQWQPIGRDDASVECVSGSQAQDDRCVSGSQSQEDDALLVPSNHKMKGENIPPDESSPPSDVSHASGAPFCELSCGMKSPQAVV
jgi:hypothetical protein